jgi:hypothetical protein
MCLAQHLAVLDVRAATFAPSRYVVGIHFFQFPNALTIATYSFGFCAFECGRFRSVPNNSKRLLIFPQKSHHRPPLRAILAMFVCKVTKSREQNKRTCLFFAETE